MQPLSRRALLHALAGGAALRSVPTFAKPVSAAEKRWALPAPAIPATPLGEQLIWTLEQVNGAAGTLTERVLKRHFESAFLAALPASDLLGLFQGYLAPNGPMAVARFEGAVKETRLRAILTTPGSDWRVTLGVDPSESNRINELFFEPVTLPSPLPKEIKSWSPIQRRLAKIAPRVSFFAAELVDGALTPLYAYTPEDPLGVGSSFKLYVLAELGRQIEAGQASWDEPLTVRDDLRSLPNGDMRLEPAGAIFPILHFVEQMIANSDNTATDHMITRLGRENVEAAFATFGNGQPERDVPLLLTREWFAIKLRLSSKEIADYLAGSVEQKRAMLETLVDPEANTLSEVEEWYAPYLIDKIEWFASAADLCRVIAALHVMGGRDGLTPIHDTLSMNPGIPFDARTWAYVGYKAGYETGVKSDVWLLQRGDGRWFTLAAVINDPVTEINGFGLWQLIMPAVDLLANRA